MPFKMMLSSLPVLVLVAMFSSVLPSAAATLTVTSTADDSTSGTLRSRVAAAQPGDTINFAVTGTIILSQGQILLDKDLTIAGPGVSDLTIRENGSASHDRIFEVAVGAVVEISQLTLKDGGEDLTSANLAANGGAVLNRGMLSARELVVRDNIAIDHGGGFYNESGATMTLRDVIFENNYAQRGGGSVYNNTGANLVLIDVSMLDYMIEPSGVLYNLGGTVTATRLDLTTFEVEVLFGGESIVNLGGRMEINQSTTQSEKWVGTLRNSGTMIIRSSQIAVPCWIRNDGPNALMEIVDTRIIGKFCGEDADGGIFNFNSGTLRMLRSSVENFKAYGSAGVVNSGNAFLNQVLLAGLDAYGEDNTASGLNNSGTLFFVNSTYAGPPSNSTENEGLVAHPGSSTHLISSTFVANSIDTPYTMLRTHEGSEVVIRNSVLTRLAGDVRICSGPGTFRLQGGVVTIDETCNEIAAEGAALVADPVIGPLQDNGGPTKTHALLPGSPAIDFAINCTYDDDLDPMTPEVPLPSDQRNWLRPAGLACDSGAYESDSVPLPKVTGHRVLDCTAQQEIATLVNGENFTVDLADVAAPACLGVGVLMEANAPSGDGSVGHDYIPAVGEVVTSPYQGENNEPFAMMGDSGWAVPGEIAACHCDSPERGNLTHLGTHTIASTPCSADSVSWTSGDKAVQCESAGGLAGPSFTTSLEVVPEPSFSLLLLCGLPCLAGLVSLRGRT